MHFSFYVRLKKNLTYQRFGSTWEVLIFKAIEMFKVFAELQMMIVKFSFLTNILNY